MILTSKIENKLNNQIEFFTYLLNRSWISAKRIVISGSCSICVSEFLALSRRVLAFSFKVSILFSKTPIWFSRSLLSSSSIFKMLWLRCFPIAHLKQIPLEQSLQKPLSSSPLWSLHPKTLAPLPLKFTDYGLVVNGATGYEPPPAAELLKLLFIFGVF